MPTAPGGLFLVLPPFFTMSHFSCHVIVPKQTRFNKVESYVIDVLAPFDENLEVESLEIECGCSLDDSKDKSCKPDCSECCGAGRRQIMVNPNVKWDWWRIGGRWDGTILDEPNASENGFNFGDEHETLDKNMATIDDLLRLKGKSFDRVAVPFALITPEGEWHEKGNMGWWGIVTDEQEAAAWQKTVREFYNSYRDCRIVCCDLHI